MPRPIQSALTRAVAQGTAGRALGRARARSAELNGQLATGLRVQKPSDDPTGYAQARGLERLQGRLAQYQRTIDAAQAWTDRTQTELDALGDLFASANEIGIRAANGVLDPAAFADQIEGLRDEAIARLNATSNGESLFAGNATDIAPIDAASGAIAPGDFSGRREREVAPGLAVAVNAVGALEVDGVSAPDRLRALAFAVRSGDQDAMRTALDGVRAGVDHYARLGGRNGTVARSLERARAQVETQNLVVGEQRATIEEIDLAEVLSANQRQQTALEAALRATAASVQTSILNYLR